MSFKKYCWIPVLLLMVTIGVSCQKDKLQITPLGAGTTPTANACEKRHYIIDMDSIFLSSFTQPTFTACNCDTLSFTVVDVIPPFFFEEWWVTDTAAGAHIVTTTTLDSITESSTVFLVVNDGSSIGPIIAFDVLFEDCN